MRAPLALAAAVSPVLALGLWASLPGIADNDTFELAELPPLPGLDPPKTNAVLSKAEHTNPCLLYTSPSPRD